MKNIILALTILLSVASWAQSGMNPCNRNISTNPENAYNDEWPSELPNTTEHFTNTGFNWAPPGLSGGVTIRIDKSQQWATPYAAQSGFISMLSPFVDGNQRGTDYLQNGDVELRDWHWEDGWELLWMNLGIYPNGEKIDNLSNSNHWLGPNNSWDPYPNNAPYFILYNRYKGVLRIFANIWFDEPGIGTMEDISVTLELDGSEKVFGDRPSYSGVFRLVNGLDKALDQTTDIISQTSPRRHPSPTGYTTQGTAMNTNQWVAADFQIAYDPCQCHVPTKLNIYFQTRDELNVDLALRSISHDKDLNLLNEDERDYFQSMIDEDGSIVAPGNVAYAEINRLLTDYQKALQKYNSELNDYNQPTNLLKIEMANLLKSGLNSGFSTFSPFTLISNDLVELLKKKPLELWGNKINTDDFSKEMANQLSNFGKKAFAEQFDFLNVSMNILAKPLKPQVPQATFTEGRIAGTIDKEYSFLSSKLLMPGSVFTANADKYNFNPYNVPAYNNVMGMFALMEIPTLKLFQGDYENITEITFEDGLFYGEMGLSRQINFIVDGGLAYAINEALDWDNDKTTFLVSFQFEFENIGFPRNVSSQLKCTLTENSNFEIIHQFKDIDPFFTSEDNYTIIGSDYYNIKDLRNRLFQFNLKTFSDDLYASGIEKVNRNGVERYYTNTLNSIKMKIIADMYFDQVAYPTDPLNENYTGAQVNTFQVRTFELYNKDKEGTLGEQLRGEIVEEYQSWANYLPGTTLLDSEIAHDDARVIEIDNTGSTPTLVIRAEKVEVTGEVKPESGYDLRIEAMTEIKVLDGGKLLPNVVARIVPDFYGNGSNPPATKAEVDVFCTGENPVYGANNPGKRAQEIIAANELEKELREQKAALNLSVYPNPASNFIQIAVQNQAQEATDIQLSFSDLTGRQILQSTQPTAESGRYMLNLPELATGVYLLQVTTGDKTAVQKVIVQQ